MKLLKWYGIVFGLLLIPFIYIFVPAFIFSGENVDIPVNSKNSARVIANKLKERRVIHFSLPFRLLTKVTRADRKLKAGLYRLNPRMSLWEVMNTLSQGKSELLTLKVPEGFTTEQIAQELEKMKVVTVPEFLKTAQDPALLKSLGITGPSVEGYLFPETYRVPLGASSDALMELMTRQFLDSVGADFERRCMVRNLHPYQAVILASIVEKEAQKTEERPVIAGVMYNRLKLKMRLEVNATLNYVLETKRAWLTNAEINETNSPYNTYHRRGLPPTPICNPGLESLRAVLDPAEVPYLYYVAQGDGSHLFAVTFAEHMKNVQLAKKIRRAKRHPSAASPK